MGLCLDCLSPPKQDHEPETPDPEERRRRLEEAATKRQKENESRGLKDPEGVKRKRRQKEAAERNAAEATGQETGLKWTVS